MRRNRLYLLISCVLVIAALVIVGGLFLRSGYAVPILMYHSIDEKAKQHKLSLCPRSFEKQMEFLYYNNYNVMTLEKVVDTIKRKKPFPRKTVAITFDDGYENNYLCSFPILKKFNIPATIFVVINNIGKEDYLNWNQINEMTRSGLISIGSHTLNHAYLPSISDEGQLRKEIFESKRILKEKTKQKNIFFSYPIGGFNEKIRVLVREAGYSGACATNPGKSYPKDDIYALKRIRISRTSDSMFVFWIESSGYYTFIKELRDED